MVQHYGFTIKAKFYIKILYNFFRYDPLTNRWYSAPPMNHARDCVAVCIALNKKTKRSLDFHPRSASPSPGASPGDKTNAPQASR